MSDFIPQPRTFYLRTNAPLPTALQTPWFGAPVDIALEARRCAYVLGFIPHHFQGRAGLLVSTVGDALQRNVSKGLSSSLHLCGEGKEILQVRLVLEPFFAPPVSDAGDSACTLPFADSLVGISPNEVFLPLAKTIAFDDGLGNRFTLADLAMKLREGKPEKISRGGGAGLNLTFAHWNKALLDASASPLVANLADFNRARAALQPEDQPSRLVASLEWWCGPSLVYDVKFDGMPLSPRTTAKPLIERLLAGHAVAEDERFHDPRWLQKKPVILADTPNWVVIVKPSGLLSVPGAMGLPDAMTITAQMVGAALTPVHRLDMDTSGLLVYSKNLDTTKKLMADFREGRIEKRYVALVRGVPSREAGEIRLPLTTNPLDRLRQVVALGGRESITTWRKRRVITPSERSDLKEPMALLELTPVTGRTHQLRLHCAHAMGLGMPIVGDPYYGPEGLAAETPETPLALHSGVLSFDDPSGLGRVYFDYKAAFE